MSNAERELHEAVEFIKSRISPRAPNCALVLGSGLSALAANLKRAPNSITVKFSDIPHFRSSTVEGHVGEFIFGEQGGKSIVIMSGRIHYYEGYEPDQVVLPIRVLGHLGVSTIILTNAAGAVADNFEPGQLMVITDHINFTGHSPLVGKNLSCGPRFVDMTEAYDKELIEIAKIASKKTDITMHTGVYAGLIGPCYETPAEVRMIKLLGADAVGMSTVFETIAARHMGKRVLGISCLTNKAAGLSPHKITHDEVIENNHRVASRLEIILNEIIERV